MRGDAQKSNGTIGETMVKSTVLVLILLTLPRGYNLAQEEDDRVHHVIYFNLRQAMADGLVEVVKKTGNDDGKEAGYPLGYNDANHKLIEWLQAKYDSLQKADWIKGKYERTLVQIKNEMEALVNANRMDFDVSKKEAKTDAINRFLVTVLEETYSLNRTGNLGTHPLSDYRFLIGGTWTHRDSGSAKGTTTASMFLRTRLYDSRGKITNLRSRKEAWFVDLLVTAHFVTNQAFVDTTRSNATAGIASDTLLSAITSSEISFGLFMAPPIHLSDWGTVGLVPRFYLSSRAQSADVFRRFSWSLRFENRSELILRGASAEIGLTSRKTPGASQGKFKWFSDERWVMDLELPLTSKKNRLGLYVQFHGEWPNVDRKDQSKANPSIYQFRVGATYDPAKLLGPLFGLAN